SVDLPNLRRRRATQGPRAVSSPVRGPRGGPPSSDSSATAEVGGIQELTPGYAKAVALPLSSVLDSTTHNGFLFVPDVSSLTLARRRVPPRHYSYASLMSDSPPGVADLLGVLAYAELTAFLRLAEDAARLA